LICCLLTVLALIDVVICCANDKPIIGILAQEVNASDPRIKNLSYIAASYVKQVESGGGRVIPILINQPEGYYSKMFRRINGLLFPGGENEINNSSGYGSAAYLLYHMALDANSRGDYFPVWGTCLGFQLISYLAANGTDLRRPCLAEDRADPLIFTADGCAPKNVSCIIQKYLSSSKMFKGAPKDLIKNLMFKNITANYHKKCITMQNFTSSGLKRSFNVLTVNNDTNNVQYISSIESIYNPIFGTQFHAEKPSFEWTRPNTPHSSEAVEAGHYFAKFFVDQARKNKHPFDNETSLLIYNYQPTYTANKSHIGAFEQCYIFPQEPITHNVLDLLSK